MDFSSWNIGHINFEDSVEMEQLMSHLRAGQHINVSFISDIHMCFLSSVIYL